VMNPNQRSTWLIQLELVGVKCTGVARHRQYLRRLTPTAFALAPGHSAA
jgi:hypothetical protein